MKNIFRDKGVPVKVWTNNVDDASKQQLLNISNMPFVYKHVAVMPDVHLGKGATVGSVIATKGAIMPCAVGVDIGCGMMAMRLPIDPQKFAKDGVLHEVRLDIESVVPVGQNGNVTLSPTAAEAFVDLGEYNAKMPGKQAALQLGSLGGGNHFIEICLDEEGHVWLMLHSGSRGIGNQLARHHIDKAQKLMEDYFINLADPDLAYFVQDTQEFKDYIHDLHWAQKYAKANRREMLYKILYVLGNRFRFNPKDALACGMIDCHHNYTQMENHFGNNVWVTRKGAVKATQGTMGIIPGSMGTKSYIVRGKGEVQSFCSCSHGAGRNFSRNDARKRFTLEDVEKQTAGVECRKDEGIIDELPGAYKDIDEVMAEQADLVEIVHTLKQVLCVKG